MLSKAQLLGITPLKRLTLVLEVRKSVKEGLSKLDGLTSAVLILETLLKVFVLAVVLLGMFPPHFLKGGGRGWV
jgi:ABC-type microcin C transport system permease subunit YejB